MISIKKYFPFFIFLLFSSFLSAQEIQNSSLPSSIDHSAFSVLLQKFVNKKGLVDYKELKKDQNSIQALDLYISDLSKIDGLNLESVNERMAYWLNLYNALVIQRILKSYPVQSVLQIPRFFDEPRYSLKSFPDEKVSLLDIEKTVFLERFNDPRIQLARINGAIGSAPFSQEAYQGETLNAKLDQVTTVFLTHPSKVSYDPKKSTLYVSPVFLWFEKFFTRWATSPTDFIRKKLPNLPPNTKIQFLGYDWKLNDARN